MIDILLNATKLVCSEDVRKSVSSLVDFVRRSPEWQQDICELEAHVDAAHEEHTVLLSGLAATKLGNLAFPAHVIDNFRISSNELVRNAFENGCDRNQAISLTISVSPEFVSTRVDNARGHNFKLSELLRVSQHRLLENPNRKRGRGLISVEDMADSFGQVGSRGVKAVFYRVPVEFEVLNECDPTIVRLTNGIYNPSLNRRIRGLVSKALTGTDVVLDISQLLGVDAPSGRRADTQAVGTSIERRIDTQAVGTSIDLHELGVSMDRSFILKVPEGAHKSAGFLRDAGLNVATTWTEVQYILAAR